MFKGVKVSQPWVHRLGLSIWIYWAQDVLNSYEYELLYDWGFTLTNDEGDKDGAVAGVTYKHHMIWKRDRTIILALTLAK